MLINFDIWNVMYTGFKKMIFITLQWDGGSVGAFYHFCCLEMILDHKNFHVCIEWGVQVNTQNKPKLNNAKATFLFWRLL